MKEELINLINQAKFVLNKKKGAIYSMDNSELAKRMKIYEAVPKTVLMRRTPVAVRL